MAAAASMEYTGIPIDVPTLALLRQHWTDIQDQLIAAIDVDYQVFDGRTFKHERFEAWLARTGIPWPLLESGQLDLSDDTFRRAAKSYPAVSPLRELRSALADLRLNALAVGRDGRNRTILSAFRSRTGRNQPSNSKSIFGTSVWLRGLIQPPPGHGVAYIDWSQQEFGIAAALSGDPAMQAAYLSGDPYLAFAKQAGAIPPDGTKKTHEDIRELYKQCVLAVQYGMEAPALALRIAQPPIVAHGLLQAHHETYRKFWLWSDAAVDQAMLFGSLHTVLGWHVHVDDNPNPRSLRNFPMQANGAEMLRLACCLATECGIEVCAPVHDAVLICAPLDRLERDIARMRALMAEASRVDSRWIRVAHRLSRRDRRARRAGAVPAHHPAPAALHGQARRGDVGTSHRPGRAAPGHVDRTGGLMAARAKRAKPTDPFDIEALGLTPEAIAELAASQKKGPGRAARPKQIPRRQTDFVMMTNAAARAGYLALGCPQALVWHYLHYRVWVTKSRTVTLPNATLKSWGVSRMRKSRALRKLEQAGLVRVESRPRRSPLVTLLARPNCNAGDTAL